MDDDQREPVAADEIILRRILKDNYNAGLEMKVSVLAFRPTKIDTDGMSFYRERFISPVELVRRTARRPVEDYYVSRLKAADLESMGFTFKLTPDPNGIPGHFVIPQLNLGRYEDKKTRDHFKEIQLVLAKLASKDVVPGFESTQHS